MNEDRLRTRILQALKEVAPDANIEALEPRHSFRDQLDMDSVDFLNFVLALETRLDVRIPDADFMKLSTLAGCVGYLGQMSLERTPAAALHG